MPGAEAAADADAHADADNAAPADPAAEDGDSGGDLLAGTDGSGSAEDGDLLGGRDGGAGDPLAGEPDTGADEGGDLLGDGGGQGAGGAEDGDLLGGGAPDEGASDGGGLLGDGGSDASESGSDLLGGGEPATEGGGDLLGGQDTAGEGGSGLMSGGDGDDGGAPTDTAAWRDAEMPEPAPADWSRLGGWYRDFFVLYYRPADHADGFLRRWLDATAPRGAGDGPAAAIFARLADPKAPGRCTKCHSVDRRAAGAGFRVNWQARTTGASGTRLTQFAHGPHLTLTSAREGCATCHAFDRAADYAASFDDRDPGTFASNFQPVDKATCTQCHTADQAGDACTQCHAYHAEEPASTAVKTEMDSAGMGR
jgi:hypothetical protein